MLRARPKLTICASGINLSADVLKLGHHGSKTSTSGAFLNKVNPEYAVISCGMGNSYGHPHKETLNKLHSKGVKILRTDEQGTVIATSDGTDITWSTQPSTTNKAGQLTGTQESAKEQNQQKQQLRQPRQKLLLMY